MGNRGRGGEGGQEGGRKEGRREEKEQSTFGLGCE